LEKPEGLNWDAASVELPEIPTIAPGQDAMSMTIAGVLPTMAASLTTNVATLQAKENMFAGKLVAAESAYQNADDSGGQAVGQLTSMLGQVGQMSQMASAPAQQAGGMTGQFGQLMQPMMKAFEGMKSEGGGAQPAGQQGAPPPGAGTPTAGGSPGGGQGGPGAAPQSGDDRAEQDRRDEARREEQDRRDEARREAREQRDTERDERADRAPAAAPPAAAGPADGRGGPGPVPVAPDHPRQSGGDEDLARRM
jgi:hypothetical protein